MDPTLAFALAAAGHAGFQLTVTVVVYPALAEVDAAAWPQAHAHHSRRISVVVVLVYAAVVAGGAALLVSSGGAPGGWGWAALGASAGALLVTALAAAPLHGRLGTGATPELRRRLLRVDRFRCALAIAALVAALASVWWS